MNKQYDFTQTGGFPLDQDVLNDLQKAIQLSETALANLLGPLVIISGCAVSGGSAAAGVVAIRGQILPFVGGTITAKVIIVETDTDLTYFDGSIVPASITRIAQFGDDGVQDNPWADFVSVPVVGVVQSIALTGDVKQIDVSEAYIAANFDGTGLGINERTGWAICNGSNGTLNRLGKFAVQRHTSETEFATMAQTGGAKSRTIAASDLPALTTDAVFDLAGGTTVQGVVSVAHSGSSLTGIGVNTGSANNPVSIIPPYIVTLFIQKL